MEENKKELQEVLRLLEELANVQSNSAKLEFAIGSKEFDRLAKKSVEKIGKRYIKQIEQKIPKLKEEYQQGLAEILSRRKTLEVSEVNQKSDLLLLELKLENCKIDVQNATKAYDDAKEKRDSLIEELSKARQEDNNANLTEMADKLGDVISEYNKRKNDKEAAETALVECEEQIKKLRETFTNVQADIEANKEEEKKYTEENEVKKILEEFENVKNKHQSLVPQQNIWQKMWGNIVNKIKAFAKSIEEKFVVKRRK